MAFVRCMSLVITVALVIGLIGCAGPNHLTRGFDLKVNQLYIDSPTIAEVCLPLTLVGTNLSMVADACFINPWYFWHDAPAGHGQPYYYEDPVTPDNEDFPKKSKEKGDPAKDDKKENVAGGGKDAKKPGASAAAPAATPAPAAPAKGDSQENRDYYTYRVQQGDTFSSIARRYYNNPNEWKKIYMANQNIVQSENRISPGQMLVIPAK